MCQLTLLVIIDDRWSLPESDTHSWSNEQCLGWQGHVVIFLKGICGKRATWSNLISCCIVNFSTTAAMGIV